MKELNEIITLLDSLDSIDSLAAINGKWRVESYEYDGVKHWKFEKKIETEAEEVKDDLPFA